jgi:hypothetical protein
MRTYIVHTIQRNEQYQMKKDVMVGACYVHGEMRNAHKILESLKGRD